MKQNKSILVVDDESEMRIALRESLAREGYDVCTVNNGIDAVKKVSTQGFDMVITDVKMPKMNGLTLLKELKKVQASLPVILITAYGTIDNAVEAMKEGAFDYIIKPFTLETIEAIVERALSEEESAPEEKSLSATIPASREIITKNAEMKKLLSIAKEVAKSNATVLLLGESGTGKELFARYIHLNSLRSTKPFIAINCASLPEGLLESELFGHEKGAFTGAIARKPGKFELANQGTILLDEITEMPLSLQAKLLRVLQEREVDSLGGKAPIPIDVRVLATTNRNLSEAIKKGEFREDLYYRLNVVPLHIPPLRKRLDDIVLLANHFLKKHSQRNNKQVTAISDKALSYLIQAPWRGNIRELENIIERSVLLCSTDKIALSNFYCGDYSEQTDTDQTESVRGDRSSRVTVKEMEKQLIFSTLDDVDGNRTQAAQLLGISIRTLRNKLQEYKKETEKI